MIHWSTYGRSWGSKAAYRGGIEKMKQKLGQNCPPDSPTP